jgi:cytochrome c553
MLFISYGGSATAGSPVAGKEKSRIHVCQECHSPDGNSRLRDYPKLAGQSSAYLLKQLSDFQSGRRKHAVMTAMTDAIAVEDLADIAAYFASNPVMNGTTEGQGHVSEVDTGVGRQLFLNGDSVRNLPACASCHGTNGKGLDRESDIAPVIGGQHRFYLRGQLDDWRNGVRTNSTDGVMNRIATLLSVLEIESLAAYMAGL